MPRSIRAITWARPGDAPTDVTDAIEDGTLSATPHPDEAVTTPKGYTLTLTLKADSTAFANDLQQALMDVDPARVTVRLEGVDDALSDLPVSVSKVPYLGDQNVAELGVKPEGHERLHPYF